MEKHKINIRIDQVDLVAAILTNTLFTAELLFLQRGSDFSHQQVTDSVLGVYRDVYQAMRLNQKPSPSDPTETGRAPES